MKRCQVCGNAIPGTEDIPPDNVLLKKLQEERYRNGQLEQNAAYWHECYDDECKAYDALLAFAHNLAPEQCEAFMETLERR